MPAIAASVTLGSNITMLRTSASKDSHSAESFEKKFDEGISATSHAIHDDTGHLAGGAAGYDRDHLLMHSESPPVSGEEVVNGKESPGITVPPKQTSPGPQVAIEEAKSQFSELGEKVSEPGADRGLPPAAPPPLDAKDQLAAMELNRGTAKGELNGSPAKTHLKTKSGSVQLEKRQIHGRGSKVDLKQAEKHDPEPQAVDAIQHQLTTAGPVAEGAVPGSHAVSSPESANAVTPHVKASSVETAVQPGKSIGARAAASYESKGADASRSSVTSFAPSKADPPPTKMGEAEQSNSSSVQKREALEIKVTSETMQKGQGNASFSAGMMQQQSVSMPTGSARSFEVTSPVRHESARFVPSSTQGNSEHQILNATPRTLEVGIATDSHGWLKVRAEMTNDGRVNALMSSPSLVVQQTLHKELAPLAAFLQGEQVQVGSLSIRADGTERSSTPSGQDMGQRQHAGDSQGSHGQARSVVPALHKRGQELNEAEVQGEGGVLWPATYVGSGSWLSVMA